MEHFDFSRTLQRTTLTELLFGAAALGVLSSHGLLLKYDLGQAYCISLEHYVFFLEFYMSSTALVGVRVFELEANP